MIKLDDLLAANPDARLHGPVYARSFAGYSFDSRLTRPGELFLAVRTDRADGHDYVEAACAAGAAGVVAQRPLALAGFGATCVVVEDTVVAIQRLARASLAALGIAVVGITGSAGKTTTKEAVAHVLAGGRRVFRNPGNYSGRFGLPIALGDLPDDAELAVLELATDHFGEMAVLADIAQPTVAVVTMVAAAHLSAFQDLEGVAREKGVLVERLPADGLAVLNADDPRVAAMAGRTSARVVTYGRQPGADYGWDDADVSSAGTAFTVRGPLGAVEVQLPWLGDHFAGAAAAALAVADFFGVAAAQAASRLASLPRVPGRLNPLPGRGGSLVLDDTYNASPEAVLAGLAVLAALPAQRRVAVLGEMAELGPLAETEHRRVGAACAGVVDRLVVRGRQAESIADGARQAGLAADKVAAVYTAQDAVDAVAAEVAPGTVILVKGSAVARMEQVVAGLMADGPRAAEVLVRQDPAWRQLVVVRPERPTWLEIDTAALATNLRGLRARCGGVPVWAVLKADGYGHGAIPVARTALQHGAWGLAVACLPEAAALRGAGIDAPCLVLGYTPAWQAREAARLGVSVTVFDAETARALSAAAEAVDREVHVHVKVDCGMHRLGVAPGQAGELVALLAGLPGLQVDGIFTHLSRADDVSAEGRSATHRELDAFDRTLAELTQMGLRPAMAHAANSAALLTEPRSWYDAVRPGIALYGLSPGSGVDVDWLAPAMTWKTQVAQVRNLAPGEAVGYGGTWTAAGPACLATLPVGYADGFRRGPQTWRYVLVRGQPTPVVGRVSMDQCSVDVSGVEDVRQGDEVVLLGQQGTHVITAEMAAEWLGTSNYEVVAAILARVPRVT